MGIVPATVSPAFSAAASAPRRTRAAWLNALATALRDHRAELIDLAHRETHLGVPRLDGEITRTTNQLDFFADVILEGSYLEAVIDHANPATVPPVPDLRRILRPIGPVAVYSASNFPFAFSVLGGDTASALAAGNPVVVKAHPGHPELSRRVAALATAALKDAGAPAGLLTLVEGFDAGVDLAKDPAITAIGFTGSLAGGRAILDLAAARPQPIPFYGELGSLNPVVITGAALEARQDELAAGLAGSFTLGAGQFCTKPGLVLVPAGSGFAQAVAEVVADAEPADLLTPSITQGFAAGFDRLATAPGAVALSGGPDARATVIAVSATDLLRAPELFIEECFGPTTVVVEVDPDQLESVLAALPGSLTATVHAEADEDVTALVSTLADQAGRVLFDGWPTGVAVSWAQHHGGPWPATNTSFTSVGATAIRRFLRPVAFQDAPERYLPEELKDAATGVPRRIDGVLQTS